MRSGLVRVIGIILFSALIISFVNNFFSMPSPNLVTEASDDTIEVPDDSIEAPDVSDETIVNDHIGGTVFNSSAEGLRYNYNNSSDVLPVCNTNTGKLNQSITEEGYLFIEQVTGPASVLYDFPEEPSDAQMNVVEFDLTIGCTEELTSSALLGCVVLNSDDGKNACAYFYYNKDTGLIELPKWAEITNGELVTVKPNEWNNYKFSYLVRNEEILAVLSINGEYAATFIGTDTSSSTVNRLGLRFHNVVSGVTYGVDNIYLGYSAYAPDDID